MGALRETLRNHRMRWLLGSQGVNGFGDVLSLVAVPFAALAVDPSGLLTGILFASRTVAQVAMLLFGGVFVDRANPRRIMIGADLVAAASQAVIGLLFLLDCASAWALVPLFAINGLGTALYIPATHKLLTSIVRPDGLQSANAAVSMTFTSVGIGGYAVGGLIVAVASPGWVLLADAGTFLLSAGLLSRIPRVATQRAAAGESWLQELRAGAAVVARTRWLSAGLVNAGLFQALVLGTLPVLGPLLALRYFGGAKGWAAILLVTSLGMLAGGVLAMRRPVRRPLRVAYAATSFAVAPGLVLVAVGAQFPIVLLGMLCYGIALAVFNTLWDTTVQQRVPVELLGRVSALDGVVSYGLRPLGLVLAAPLAAAVGADAALLLCACVAAVMALAVLAVPSWHGEGVEASSAEVRT